jgi:UDP-N-acetylglucosamine 2-epimerase (non-hydrolysing)
MAPLIRAAKENPDFNVKVCLTGQHKEMVEPLLRFFNIETDFNLEIMKPNQTLNSMAAIMLKALPQVFEATHPDVVLVQGDTTTAFCAGFAAFNANIPIAHIEAGLRSFDLTSPFPEEGNRKLLSAIATYHFTPTNKAKENLNKEGITHQVHTVGNTVIDALLQGLDIIKNSPEPVANTQFESLNISDAAPVILVTSHRRESFGTPFQNICTALKKIAEQNPEVQIIYPVHLNPNIRNVVFKELGDIQNIHCIDPLNYNDLISLMNKSSLILTDSGGIQEEAPTLGKPVLVLRDVTERTEGVEAGTAKLVGTDTATIVKETQQLLDSKEHYEKMSAAKNPYGDGKSSEAILSILQRSLK